MVAPPLHLPPPPAWQDDGDQRPLRGFLPGTPAQRMRDFQADFGLKMHGPQALASLPADCFRAAFLGDAPAFAASFDPAQHLALRAWELRLPLPAVVVSGAAPGADAAC